MCVCSLRYPACNALAPYCHLWPAPLYQFFPHYLINGTIFEKKLLNTKWLFWFSLQLLSETFLILRRTERDRIKNVHRSSCKVPLFLWDFNETWIFSARFSKNTLKLIYINPLGAELLHAGRRTDGRRGLMKLTVAFRNSANALRPVTLIWYDTVRANLRLKMNDTRRNVTLFWLCAVSNDRFVIPLCSASETALVGTAETFPHPQMAVAILLSPSN